MPYVTLGDVVYRHVNRPAQIGDLVQYEDVGALYRVDRMPKGNGALDDILIIVDSKFSDLIGQRAVASDLSGFAVFEPIHQTFTEQNDEEKL